MDWEDWALYITCAATIVVCAGALVVCFNTPSCEDRGGHNVNNGILLVPMLVGKVIMLQPLPDIRCVLDDNSSQRPKSPSDK